MNRQVIAASIALALHAIPLWAADDSGDAQRVFAKVAPSVVTVKTLDDHGAPEGQGSGVLVGEGLVATNCHVVQYAATIRILSAQGELTGEWSRQLPGLDLCLLTVSGLKGAPVKLRPSSALVVGEPVYAVGNPLGFGLAVSTGLIAVLRQETSYPGVIATAPLSPGSSGGGLFDSEGRLLGVTTAVLGIGQNLNRIVAADAVADLVARGAPRPPAPTIPAPERRWNHEAERLQGSGDWAALENHARAWSQAQPSSAWPLVYMGMAQGVLKRGVQAEATLRRALALDENLPLGWLNLAIVLFDQGRPEEAEQALQQAQSKQPAYAEPGRNRATWLRKQGKPQEALAQIKGALRQDPSRSANWALLGQIEDELGHTAEASRAFATALKLGSVDADVKRRLAALSAQSGKTDDAIRMGVLKDVSTAQESDALVGIGMSEMKQGRPGQAEDALRKAIALSPKSAAAWNDLGEVLRLTNRLAQAEEAYTKSIELGPNDPVPYQNRAEARRGRKKLDIALEDARRAIDLAPKSAMAWRVYGSIKLELRDYREASAAFGKMDALTSLSAEELTSWGESLLGLGDLDGALKALQKAEAQDPKLVRIHLTMAKLLGGKGDIEGALGYENRALATDPGNVHAWSGKGYALMKLGRMPQAVEALETAVRLDPELSNAWINLGEAHMRNHNLGRAIQALEKAITLAPTAMDARMFLAQSYLGARLPAKSREQAERMLTTQANFTPALGVVTMAYLMEGNATAASVPYTKLKTLAPAIARSVRKQAIAAGFAAAAGLPE